jgi:hypothetical protein
VFVDFVGTNDPLTPALTRSRYFNKLNHERRHRPNNKISFVVTSPLGLNWKFKLF